MSILIMLMIIFTLITQLTNCIQSHHSLTWQPVNLPSNEWCKNNQHLYWAPNNTQVFPELNTDCQSLILHSNQDTLQYKTCCFQVEYKCHND